MGRGLVPADRQPTLLGWMERNVNRFGEPKQSGDDCHETAAAQLQSLFDGGLQQADVTWHHEMWAILRGIKTSV